MRDLQPCTWPQGCSRRTRNPNGRCHEHQRDTSSMSTLTLPENRLRFNAVVMHLASEEPTPESRADDEVDLVPGGPEGYPHRDTMPRRARGRDGRLYDVTGYPEKDRFSVVGPDDSRTTMHRDDLTFLPHRRSGDSAAGVD